MQIASGCECQVGVWIASGCKCQVGVRAKRRVGNAVES